MMKTLIIITSLALVSCSGNVKNTWTCPTPEGGKGNCMSIKEADLSFSPNENQKNNFSYINSAQKIEINLIAPKLKDLKKLQVENSQFTIQELENKPKLRTPEKIGRIWFAPYIDAEGNQHSEYVVMVVDEESKWLIQK